MASRSCFRTSGATFLQKFVDVRGSDRAYFPALGDNVTYFKKTDAEPVFAGERALLYIAEIFEFGKSAIP
jgi:hypothetical protein